jgi:hypothetical protein
MNKEAWLKFLRHSTEAHHIREIFNGTYALIGLESVQKQFFERIDHLMCLQISEHTRTALENLREDIELEIEHGEMRNKSKPSFKTNWKPFEADKQEKINGMIDRIKDQLDALEEMIEGNNTIKVMGNNGKI